MEMKKIFGNLEFGPLKGYKMSHLGLALRNSANEIVSYDKTKNEIVNVDLIDFNADNMVFGIPTAIKDVKVGDIIRHVNGHDVFVTSTENGIHVIDVAAGEKKEIIPTKSMFGFDFVTKIVCLIDFGAANASADQPFGNMLPLLMLSGSNGGMKDMLPMMMLMNGGKLDFGGMDLNNPLMLMAMCGGSESTNFFPMMLTLAMSKKN